MATVQDVVDLFRSIAGPERDELSLFRKHLPLLNAAQRSVWKILTSRKPMNNPFVVSSQSATPSNPDYFGPLVVGTREYALPGNFHQLRLIECITDGYEHTKFRKEPIDSPAFKETREFGTGTPFGLESLYDIIGERPGKIMFAGYPPTALQLRLWYVRTPTVLVAITDSLNDFPIEGPDLMARWAAGNFLLGSDFGKWSDFERQWSTEVERSVFGDNRDNTAPTVVQGFLE